MFITKSCTVSALIFTLPTGAVVKYCNEHVCVCVSVYECVCLSVHEHISLTTCMIFSKFSVHVAYCCGSVCLWQSDAFPREIGNFGVYFPIENVLYSIAFGTHTKTAELIEMPFGLMIWVGPTYHVLDGAPDPLREDVAAHSKVMGHTTVCCAKTAEQIVMQFWMKTRVGP